MILIVNIGGGSNSQGRNGHKRMLSQPFQLLRNCYRRRIFTNIHGSYLSDIWDPMNLRASNMQCFLESGSSSLKLPILQDDENISPLHPHVVWCISQLHHLALHTHASHIQYKIALQEVKYIKINSTSNSRVAKATESTNNFNEHAKA